MYLLPFVFALLSSHDFSVALGHYMTVAVQWAGAHPVLAIAAAVVAIPIIRVCSDIIDDGI